MTIGPRGRAPSLLLALAATLCALPAAAQPPQPTVASLHAPADVSAFIKRRMTCNHWAGEQGDDAARNAEIGRTMTKLHCDTLDRDEKQLRARYSHDPKVLHDLTVSSDWLE